MNICFFHSSMQPGGIERTISLLANMYVQNGDKISIITLDNRDSFYSISPDVQQYHFGLSGNSQSAFQAVKRNFRTVAAFRNAIKSIRPDVIVTFGANTELTAYLAKIGLSIKLIGAERANPFYRTESFWSKNACRIAKRCDGFLFQTQGAASYYPESVQKKALVVQNGIDSAIYERLDQPWPSRKNICSVGRMDTDKGIDDVIRTFAIVHERAPQIVLDLYGDGEKRNELEDLATSLRLSNHVIFHGQCNTMPEEYAEHRIFLMMSRSEGFPNVLLEAMASGCVCVAGNCNFGPSELIRDGENGFLVPVGDCEAAAERVLFALENDEIAQSISQKAKATRLTNNIKTIGQQIHDYLKRFATIEQEDIECHFSGQ